MTTSRVPSSPGPAAEKARQAAIKRTDEQPVPHNAQERLASALADHPLNDAPLTARQKKTVDRLMGRRRSTPDGPSTGRR
jgi:hypothetical protein